jgi:SAM-dependent methyltransferase
MSFDALAPYYRGMEFVIAGGLLHRCRTAFLDQAARAKRALLLGEGPGRYLVELLRVNPRAQVTCVDSSVRMLAVARQRVRARGLPDERVQFVCADCAAWPGVGGPFDLVATHFFLDCFRPDQLAQLIPKIAEAASPGATWVLSDFRVPPGGWQRLRARAVLKLAYLFFRWTTGLPASGLTPPQPFLEAAAFCLVQQRVFHHGLLHADLWRKTNDAFFADLPAEAGLAQAGGQAWRGVAGYR